MVVVMLGMVGDEEAEGEGRDVVEDQKTRMAKRGWPDGCCERWGAMRLLGMVEGILVG